MSLKRNSNVLSFLDGYVLNLKRLFRFAAGVGITVRGTLTAEGTEEERIVFTSEDEPPARQHNRTVRLVDGPLVSEGIIQVAAGHWVQVYRSQCTGRQITVYSIQGTGRQGTCIQVTGYMYTGYRVQVYRSQGTCIQVTGYMYTGYRVQVDRSQGTGIQVTGYRYSGHNVQVTGYISF